MFGVIETSSIYIEGDERSRTNPGHGYPAHSVNTIKFHEFGQESELLRWVENNRSSLSKCRIIKFEPIEVETKVVIKSKVVVRHSPKCTCLEC